MNTRVTNLPEEIEAYRDRYWCREPELRVEDALAAERFIERVGFCSALTDSRRTGPSLYIAVCGRRDVHMPRNVQKDPEARLTWNLKDELVRRGQVYYGKLRANRAIFVARQLLPYFQALITFHRSRTTTELSSDARSMLKVLQKEWEMASRDLRMASGVKDRTRFNKAIDELQRALKIIPGEIVYQPIFTYIWTLADARFHDVLQQKHDTDAAITEIARVYLKSAGMTLRGELARVTGLSNADAGAGNWALVDEGFATRLGPGIYLLSELQKPRAGVATAPR